MTTPRTSTDWRAANRANWDERRFPAGRPRVPLIYSLRATKPPAGTG
ncbi:hypothetical protein [Nonomuraea africana]